MPNKAYRYLFLILLGMALCNPTTSSSAAEEQRGSHKAIAGIITQGPGGLRVKTPQGNTYQLNEMDQRHELEPFKEGDEVTVTVDENNNVIDMHPKGQEVNHRFVTGKLIYVGKMKNQIKLQTSEGEKIFSLAHLEAKNKTTRGRNASDGGVERSRYCYRPSPR